MTRSILDVAGSQFRTLAVILGFNNNRGLNIPHPSSVGASPPHTPHGTSLPLDELSRNDVGQFDVARPVQTARGETSLI